MILEAAVRVFSEVGSRGATTRRIAEEARVNEVTLFRHLGSKEALLSQALKWMSQRVEIAVLPAEPWDPASELTPLVHGPHTLPLPRAGIVAHQHGGVQQYLGHRSLQTTTLYLHLTSHGQEHAVATLEALMQ